MVGVERLARARPDTPAPPVTPERVDLVRRHGVLTPLPVRPVGHRRWEIVLGEADWIAAQRAGVHEIPVVEVDAELDVGDLELLGAVEGVSDPIVGAERLRARLGDLRAERGRGALKALAMETGRAPAWICHRLRLLDLGPDFRRAVSMGLLSAGQGRALVRAPDDVVRAELAVRAIDEGWSVRRLEQAIRTGERSGRSPAPANRDERRSPDLERLERRVGGITGCPIEIDEKRGRLVFDYRRSLDVLDGLLARLCGDHPGAVPGCVLCVDEPAGTVVVDYRGSLDVLDDLLRRLGVVDTDGW